MVGKKRERIWNLEIAASSWLLILPRVGNFLCLEEWLSCCCFPWDFGTLCRHLSGEAASVSDPKDHLEAVGNSGSQESREIDFPHYFSMFMADFSLWGAWLFRWFTAAFRRHSSKESQPHRSWCCLFTAENIQNTNWNSLIWLASSQL